MQISAPAAATRLGILAACGLATVALAACETTEQESAAIGRADKVAYERAKQREEREQRRHERRGQVRRDHDRRTSKR